ncbi:hypothetical protein C8F04DRAFT_1332479 [Mycena alexandri]|uniref:Uncharacterized protein n=1 Tax=Mycena alexandri TaxID=1745969 RepID=A0AAD6WQX8_9AGAR|nr:hypothetical protein C8F04DRAFT_1332479 [Mycena alexandri]
MSPTFLSHRTQLPTSASSAPHSARIARVKPTRQSRYQRTTSPFPNDHHDQRTHSTPAEPISASTAPTYRTPLRPSTALGPRQPHLPFRRGDRPPFARPAASPARRQRHPTPHPPPALLRSPAPIPTAPRAQLLPNALTPLPIPPFYAPTPPFDRYRRRQPPASLLPTPDASLPQSPPRNPTTSLLPRRAPTLSPPAASVPAPRLSAPLHPPRFAR